jgi:hypothetical protein
VTEKLVIYQQNLKERSKQLKEMVLELKNYQSQVHAYKFEIERIDGQIKQCKEAYFQMMKDANNGIIQEIPGQEDMGGMEMQNQMMMQQ